MEATTDTVSQAEAAAALGADTLRGDIRDRILDNIARDMPCWTKLSEFEQRKFISRADEIAVDTVREAVRIAAHHGFAHLTVTTGKWTVSDGLKLEVKASSRVEDITALAEHGIRGAVLVLAEPSVFFGQRAEAVADKDQPDLPIDGETETASGEGVSSPVAQEAEGAAEVEADRSPLPEPPTSNRSRRRAPADADA